MKSRWFTLIIIVLVILFGSVAPQVHDGNSEDHSQSKDNFTNEINTEVLTENATRNFYIDYKNNTFMKDDLPFRYISGSLHYFRVPPEYWRDRLRKFRAAGLNAISTYVEWSFHEPKYRQYEWTGAQDLIQFLKIAQEEDLYVILRPGPYICAERDMGGLPYWLLTKYPNIKLRTSDKDYLAEIDVWFEQLFPKIKPLLYGNGGPIITVQVENEYGSFPACDGEYMMWLQKKMAEWVQSAAVLFTTDGGWDAALFCGKVAGAYPTVDFGTAVNPSTAFAAQRRASNGGPPVNSEYYPGWLTHWGEPMARVSAADVARSLRNQLDLNANVNFYMFLGGTNFGFSAGANLIAVYQPDITSYDYDAPMSEAGDPTSKYHALRQVISKYLPLPDMPIPEPTPKASYGKIVFSRRMDLLSDLGRKQFGKNIKNLFDQPPTFEELDQYSGFVLYEAKLPSYTDPSMLKLEKLRDRAYIFINGVFIGVLSRTYKIESIPIVAAQGETLSILVENQGRVNFGPLANDFKGILGEVTIGSFGIKGWNVTQFPMDTKDFKMMPNATDGNNNARTGFLREGPTIFRAHFRLPEGPRDTFLNTAGWGKGMVWVNDYNLGRYWPSEGPQVSLFVPAVAMKPSPQINTIYLLELQKSRSDHNFVNSMAFESKPTFINKNLAKNNGNKQ